MIILTPDAKYRFKGRDNDLDDMAVVKETWVENVYNLQEGLFDDTGIMIDIGANIGATSVYAASLSDKVKVYAFEPEPHNLKLLQENVTNSGLAKQVNIIPMAVWSERGQLWINNLSGSSYISGTQQNSSPCEAITLESVFADNKIANCDVLKMDVEGAEYNILLAAPDEILKKVAHLRLEFHASKDKEAFGKLIEKLSHCFNIHIIGAGDKGGNIYADRY